MMYKNEQRNLQISKLKTNLIFNKDKGFGNYFEYTKRPYVLEDGKNNLSNVISNQVIQYFLENNIDWWGDNAKYPTGHLLSSQIQCLNFLFPLRNDKEAVLELVKSFDNEVEDILPVIGDKENQYIAFEFTYENEKLLGENDFGAKRGSLCTSVDAFIFAIKNNTRLLIPIEWKYTESYDSTNKALEYKKGITRQARYNHLIKKSSYLKDFEKLEESPYYYEPLYEFMRQTLLMEHMIKLGLADDILHVIVIPVDNKELLGCNYNFSFDSLETIWSDCLKHPDKCRFIDTSILLKVYERNSKYNDTFKYLNERYMS